MYCTVLQVQIPEGVYCRYGYLKDYPIEQFLRDIRVNQILEGTNQVSQPNHSQSQVLLFSLENQPL